MLTLGMFLAGLVALVAGAELLVRGASKLALSFGISPLVVGLTIVAFGTSAPEVAVSVGAVLGGRTDIAIGNVVGSNIFNVLFILGLSAVITPLVELEGECAACHAARDAAAPGQTAAADTVAGA